MALKGRIFSNREGSVLGFQWKLSSPTDIGSSYHWIVPRCDLSDFKEVRMMPLRFGLLYGAVIILVSCGDNVPTPVTEATIKASPSGQTVVQKAVLVATTPTPTSIFVSVAPSGPAVPIVIEVISTASPTVVAPTATSTATPTPEPTLTAVPTAIPTPTTAPTATPTSEFPNTAVPTAILTPTTVSTATPTHEPTPTAVPTATPTHEPTPTPRTSLDRDVLVALYNATDGPNWANNSKWLSDAPIKEWYGISTDASERVTRLNLIDNQLSNSIPQELVNLANLQQLNLSANQLGGPIPVELGNLTKLEQLNLWNNRLAGEIPQELGNLANLHYLDLSANQLSGPIPVELGNLTKLRLLLLWGNRLAGEIPQELGNLANLRELFLFANLLGGPIPAELGNLTKLRVLNLSEHQLSGPIPAELGNLSSLVLLLLGFNRLTGEIPTEIGNLTQLRNLKLHANKLNRVIPLELGNLSSLELLYLDGNRSFGCIPEVVRRLLANRRSKGIRDLQVCTGFEFDVVHTGDGDPQLYNDNLFVLPVVEDIGTDGRLPWRDYAIRFFEYFDDQFDFLVFVSHLDESEGQITPTHYRGTYRRVMNEVKGIGQKLFSYSAQYESAGVLQGVLHLSYMDAFSRGPLLHELMHRWANHVVPTNVGTHWGFSSANGQLGGFDIANLVERGDGRYSAAYSAPWGLRAHVRPYSPIELYLAGFIPPEEVPDLWVAEDGQVLRSENGGCVEADDGHCMFIASKVSTYTIEDIVVEHGERIPNSSQSQRDFRAAAVLVIDRDHPLLRWQLDRLSSDIASFGNPGVDEYDDTYNFYEATGGRATITMDGLSQYQKSTPTGPLPDRDALVALFNATDGPNWANNDKWLSEAHVGEWHGVDADARGRVIILDLPNNQLSGPIPPELGALSNLLVLTLSSNQLTGEIPMELGNLISLEVLSLSSNQLTGEIPTELGDLLNLLVLTLSSNQLTGEIPAELGDLLNLQVLFLSSNHWFGEIRTEFTNNQFTGCVPKGLASVEKTDLDQLDLPACKDS